MCNAALAGEALRTHCTPDTAGGQMLAQAVDRLGLSARGHDRILRVARTLADMAAETHIGRARIAEAVQYRRALGGGA